MDSHRAISASYKTIKIWDIRKKKLETSIKNEDDMLLKYFICNSNNKIYVANGLGIATFDIAQKKIMRKMIFDEKIEKIVNSISCLNSLLPESSKIE